MSLVFRSRMDVISKLTGEHGKKLTPLSWWTPALRALDDRKTRELCLWLKRQEGKSTFVGACASSTILTKRNAYVLLVAGSEKQQKAIYHRKLRRPLERLMKQVGLDDLAHFTANGVEIPAMNSAVEVIAPNQGTAPGRTITELYFDECRSIPDDVFVTLAPSVIGSGGKMILASTAGRPAGFFYEICQHPTPETLLIHTDQHENPHASQSVFSYLKGRLGLLSPAALSREIDNQFAEDGQQFLSAALIDHAVDPYLVEWASSEGEAFAFGDLSRKRDLTSVVVLVRLPARVPEAQDHLTVASLKLWDPKTSPTGEVEFAEVRQHLADLAQRFPRLRRVLIDSGAEAGSVLPFCRQHPVLTLSAQEFHATQESNRELWGALKARLESGTLSLPRHHRLLLELKSLRQESTALGLSWRITDGSKKLHRDVSLALAGACFAAGSPPVPLTLWCSGTAITSAPATPELPTSAPQPVGTSRLPPVGREQSAIEVALRKTGFYFPGDTHHAPWNPDDPFEGISEKFARWK
jgi:hypothetical protein